MKTILVLCLLASLAALLLISGCTQVQTPSGNEVYSQGPAPVYNASSASQTPPPPAPTQVSEQNKTPAPYPQSNTTISKPDTTIQMPNPETGANASDSTLNTSSGVKPNLTVRIANQTNYSNLHCVRLGPEFNGTQLKDMELIVRNNDHFAFISYGLNGEIGTRVWKDGEQLYDVGLKGPGEVQILGPEKGRPINLFLQIFGQKECKNETVKAASVAVPGDIVFNPK